MITFTDEQNRIPFVAKRCIEAGKAKQTKKTEVSMVSMPYRGTFLQTGIVPWGAP